MLQKIDNSEIKTVLEFRTQYADKWFNYVVIEKGEDYNLAPEEYRVMVTYVADTKKELSSSLDDEYMKKGFTHFGMDWGVNVDPEPWLSIGGIENEIIWI